MTEFNSHSKPDLNIVRPMFLNIMCYFDVRQGSIHGLEPIQHLGRTGDLCFASHEACSSNSSTTTTNFQNCRGHQARLGLARGYLTDVSETAYVHLSV